MQLLHNIREMIESDLCDSERFLMIDCCRPVFYNYWNENPMNPMELHLIANLFLVILEKSPEENQIELISTVLKNIRPESIQFYFDSM